ncbi:SDR family NAD(P)-dependent oxidoreductase [Streptomyces malaysiensis]|uniref:SDR family NAD(P)-dependent oxidoreductase n=1 Tax=Streptomyces malaysiensis subsp. samsunensis TaxID=459658 RepID=A0A9X2M4Y7_STRMQ|nr:SDR family NAD(P)-dependent oxidoreductase [Streptomyces samsunensis]MCQ8835488.1 SDR family NAD(P)-dependent oxidoreductase [Streptomyces samsunensis]
MTDLAGARALVTGAASGIGLGIARALLDRGAAVAVVDIDAEAVEAAVDQLGERGTVSGFRADVSELDEFEALREDVEQRLGPVDILANNAGSLTTPSHCGHRRPRWWSEASRST